MVTLFIATFLLESAQTQHLVLRRGQMDSLILGVKGSQTQNIFQISVKMGDLEVTLGKVTWEATERKSEAKDLDLGPIQLRLYLLPSLLLHQLGLLRPAENTPTQCLRCQTRRRKWTDKVPGYGRHPFKINCLHVIHRNCLLQLL